MEFFSRITRDPISLNYTMCVRNSVKIPRLLKKTSTSFNLTKLHNSRVYSPISVKKKTPQKLVSIETGTVKKEIPLTKLLWVSSPNCVMSSSNRIKTVILNQFLDGTYTDGKRLKKYYPPWRELSVAHCTAVADTLKTMKLSGKKSQSGISLFGFSPTVLRQRYLFLQECCITEVHPKLILNFPQILKLPLLIFKQHAQVEEDILACWISQLPLKLREETYSLIEKETTKRHHSPIGEFRDLIAANYLSSSLNCSFKESLNYVVKHLKTSPQTIKSFIEAVEILKKIGFTKEQFFMHPSVLNTQGGDLRSLLESVPEILGEKTKKLLLEFPCMCSFDLKLVMENVRLLADFELPLRTLKRNIEMLAIDPWELKEKIYVLQQYPEIKVLRHSSSFAAVFRNMGKMQIRMEALRATDRRRISCRALVIEQDSEYLRLLHSAKRFMIPMEIIHYLSHFLEKPEGEVFAALKTHPHWRHVNMENLYYVVELLRKMFTKEQIFCGIHLVIYPVREVATALEEMEKSCKSPKANKSIRLQVSDVRVLQYVVYLIEQKSNFSGNRVFMDEDIGSQLSFNTNVTKFWNSPNR